MKVAFIARSTLNAIPGGDTIHIKETAAQLQTLGVQVDTWTTGAGIPYGSYDLFHFFNLIRPADILPHLSRIHQPFVITPVLVDYQAYDRYHRPGFSGWLFRRFSAAQTEYIKTMARWCKGQDTWPGWIYLQKGQHKSMQTVLDKAALVMPNSTLELQELQKQFIVNAPGEVVHNGINARIFQNNSPVIRNPKLVVCAARIEGIKNQLNLIRALKTTGFTLLLIGRASPNQQVYYEQCRKEAGPDVRFIDHVSQEELKMYYQQAAVHVLPSWFETCGLSSLEAAAMGCQVVITDKGFAKEYFGDQAFYCDPGDPASIRDAVELAAAARDSKDLVERIRTEFTWEQAAAKTFSAYQKLIRSS